LGGTLYLAHCIPGLTPVCTGLTEEQVFDDAGQTRRNRRQHIGVSALIGMASKKDRRINTFTLFN